MSGNSHFLNKNLHDIYYVYFLPEQHFLLVNQFSPLGKVSGIARTNTSEFFTLNVLTEFSISISPKTFSVTRTIFEGKRRWRDEKRNLGCHRCYGTNSVLAIKINVVLEINSSYSADRREGTDDLKTLQNFANKKKLFILKLTD